MARNRRGRHRPKHGGGQDAAARSGHQQDSNNAFSTLASVGEEDGELNANLRERFANTSLGGRAQIPKDHVPTWAPLETSKDILEYVQLANKPVRGGEWLQKPEIPYPEEFYPDNPDSLSGEGEKLIDVDEHIRPHKVEGAYENNEDYLRTKYELLREDTIRPLRECINAIRAAPFQDEAEYDNHSIGVYDPVHITSLVFSNRGLATRVNFSLSRVKKHIRWAQSKRLIVGTLVALSPTEDSFQSQCVLAIVAGRSSGTLNQNPPQIDLFFARPEDQEIDPMRKWVMVECRSSFFEASRHNLLALQHMMREPFPLSEHLVDVQKEVAPPRYLQHNPNTNLSSLVNPDERSSFESVNVLQDWPPLSSQSLDKSQSRAVKRMLTRSLAIVQGPPGTGKTYSSVVALRIMLENMFNGDPPIIITAQTNHAVDQIIRHVMEFEPNIVRLGGRSKDEDIKKRTVFEIRQTMPPHKLAGSRKSHANNTLRRLTKRCQMLLAPLEASKGPLDHRVLLELGLITEDQRMSLEPPSGSVMSVPISENPGLIMEQWLGRCLAPCTRPVQPDDYGLGFEEEDYDVEQLAETEAEGALEDEDVDAIQSIGEICLSDNYKGKGFSLLNPRQIKEVLDKTSDLTTIQNSDRGAIYNYFLREVKRLLVEQVRKIAKEFAAAAEARKVSQWEEDLHVLSKARIIGCTTTGLSKYRALISATKARVVLVEEAAETQESPVTAACIPTLEHLILVGDHFQLRPHCQVHEFEDEPYFLNLSLFERLVNNEVEFDALARQRRMIPEIRRLLLPIYEETLKDHESVKDLENRPPVEGMGGNNSFFFCHEWPEDRDANMSTYNELEGEMVVNFIDYLLLNAVHPDKITVLTFYNGQRKLILRKMRKHPHLQSYKEFKVVTVDSYQGEENDIVLLSLVRSNKRHAIGFLSSDNRACVALSRAKRGFYLFGNAELLACQSGTWAAVVDIMQKNKSNGKVTLGQKRRIGHMFPLVCSEHGNKTWIAEPNDFNLLQGGCGNDCTEDLLCGHKCSYRCHP
ncbi:P-loop containing nucleoside triphosphate hydrolase protein [Pyrenochaeta sp. DS3sAY3a]|nr:P-loop containing nucleoside triphosphate hydrolase protein [Pyrenochaeta sp. DS3sAY3a]